ncbi:MAG: toll/interleukin-1 receptor domain-containing protein [Ruminococcaceae bacterium]|nr:toll/interleukin-1 receptor domain-containing protein [Oscillospiraceae bacterium]
MKKYQIFISYRRDGGADLAGRISDRLTALGYSVFLDVESMRSGKFNDQLYRAIEACNDFLLILPPNGLDRCTNPEDWVRLEIAHALNCNRNIVPILARGFAFPETLPGDIDDIRHMDGIRASIDYFDAVMDKIESHLHSRRQSKSRLATPKVSIKETKIATKVQGDIPLPRFLKVSESTFLRRGQSYLGILNPAHEAFDDTKQKCLATPELEEYLAFRKEQDWPSYLADFHRRTIWHNATEEDIRKRFETDFKQGYHTCFFMLSRDFDAGVSHILQEERFPAIHDATLLETRIQANLSQIHSIRDYVTHLYTQAPAYHQTRVAELISLLFLLNYRPHLPFRNSSFNARFEIQDSIEYATRYCHAILEHTFLGLNLDALVRFVLRTEDQREAFSRMEVSFSIQTIVETVSDNAEQNTEIRRFLAALLAFYQFLSWPNPQAPARLRNFLLINYKYLRQNGVDLAPETIDFFRDGLDTCRK